MKEAVPSACTAVVCLRNEVKAAAQPVMEERAELLDHEWVDMEKAEQLREKRLKRAVSLSSLILYPRTVAHILPVVFFVPADQLPSWSLYCGAGRGGWKGPLAHPAGYL